MSIIYLMHTSHYIRVTLFFTGLLFSFARGQDNVLAEVSFAETAGLFRETEYAEISLQVALQDIENQEWGVVAVEENSGEKIICQFLRESDLPERKISLIKVIFPVSLEANATKTFILKLERVTSMSQTDLRVKGEGLELQIENRFFRADLTKSLQSEAKSHECGQLRELLMKMGFDQRLFRTENRLHWGPNFHKQGLEYYRTIAGWEKPRHYEVARGPYLIRTIRRDTAPDHPEILLTAVYKFYANQPYFKFYSNMEFLSDVWLHLLRNDEMTMDSMFTHAAFQRANGEIVDLPFFKRYDILNKRPIANGDPWLCFYHAERGYAFGSIRLLYDNTNVYGESSPTCLPHTKISDGAEGGKYWNRRLIHDHLTFVPRGSRYREENAYLVFKIDPQNPFVEIRYWASRLRNPLQTTVNLASD
jgi:hypothetical protein